MCKKADRQKSLIKDLGDIIIQDTGRNLCASKTQKFTISNKMEITAYLCALAFCINKKKILN